MNGSYITGTGEDNDAAYQKGYEEGKGEVKNILYNGVKKEYTIVWNGKNKSSTYGDAYNRTNSDSASPWVNISTGMTPDGIQGTLVNINLHIWRHDGLPFGTGESSASNYAYVQDMNGNTLATYSNTNQNTTANYTYQLIGTGYQDDTIRVSGALSNYSNYTLTGSSSYSYRIQSEGELYGTVTYLVPEDE